jgi:thioredoxin-like negative regulator of GroEL
MAPIVNGLEHQYSGKVSVRRVDANSDPTANKFGINAVPTYIFLDSSGAVIEKQIGGDPTKLEQSFKNAAG